MMETGVACVLAGSAFDLSFFIEEGVGHVALGGDFAGIRVSGKEGATSWLCGFLTDGGQGAWVDEATA